MNDFDLVRKYEPILRFHRDENFYPIQVENYLSKCSLHVIKDCKLNSCRNYDRSKR